MRAQLWIGLLLVVAGIVLLVLGINATQSTGEELRETWTGHYSDRTTWYLIIGVAGIVIGGILAILGARKPRHPTR